MKTRFFLLSLEKLGLFQVEHSNSLKNYKEAQPRSLEARSILIFQGLLVFVWNGERGWQILKQRLIPR